MIIIDKKIFGIFMMSINIIRNLESIIFKSLIVTEILLLSWGMKGTGDGDFLHPHGIDVDSEGFYLCY
jgi:hypothetical protein